MSSPIQLSVIIVSYNTAGLTQEAVQSVFDSFEGPSSEFAKRIEPIVVDNASSDSSIADLQRAFGTSITLIQRKTNGGFAVANNEGIRASKGRFILLLNSDTIVHTGALELLVHQMEEREEFGILSCRLLNRDGSYQPQGGALPTLLNISVWWLWPIPGTIPLIPAYQNMTEIDHASEVSKARSIETGWVGGTAMMLRRSMLDQIGYLDENIFMYAEDVEFCLRAYRGGWKVGIFTGSEIIHIGSASGSGYRAKLGEVKGILYLVDKHFSKLDLHFIKLVFIFGAVLRWLLFGILYQKEEARRLYSEIVRITLTEEKEQKV